MSDFFAYLYSHLTGHAALSSLIDTRLYPGYAPQDVQIPFVVYYEFANPMQQSLNNLIAVERPRVQYSVYADKYATCVSIVRALKDALSSLPHPVVFEDERAYHDMTSALYRRDLDVRIAYAE